MQKFIKFLFLSPLILLIGTPIWLLTGLVFISCIILIATVVILLVILAFVSIPVIAIMDFLFETFLNYSFIDKLTEETEEEKE